MVQTYWNSEVILHNVDLFISKALDDHLVAQTLGFSIGMFQNTEIVITIFLLLA